MTTGLPADPPAPDQLPPPVRRRLDALVALAQLVSGAAVVTLVLADDRVNGVVDAEDPAAPPGHRDTVAYVEREVAEDGGASSDRTVGSLVLRLGHPTPLDLGAGPSRALDLIADQVVDVLLDLRRRTLVTEALRTISHDIKTPLAATIGYAELAADLPHVRADATAAAYVKKCETSARRTIGQIDGVVREAREALAALDARPV